MTQKDLPQGAVSGLDMAIKVLKNVEEIGFPIWITAMLSAILWSSGS